MHGCMADMSGAAIVECGAAAHTGGMSTVLILGAQGRIGQAAVQAFSRAGWQVLAQARRGSVPGARTLNLPLHDLDALAAAARGAQELLYAVNPPYPRWSAELLPLARQGMDLAERLGARLLLPGNVYAYGAGMPERLDEQTPEAPSNAFGALRQQLEHELAERAAQGRLRSLVLRAGDFFGGGRGTWFDLAITRHWQRGRIVYPGPLDRLHAWAYLPDLAQAFVALAAQPAQAAHERLHFGGHSLTGAELGAALVSATAELGVKADVRRMPWWPWQLARPFVPVLGGVFQMRYLWQRPHRLGGWHLQQRLGKALPHTPLPEALRSTLLSASGAEPPRR